MDKGYLELWLKTLVDRGVALQPGLSAIEACSVETTYGFRFPADLGELLEYALPVADRFPNWRNGPEAKLRERLSWPIEGICFDVERNDFWLSSWGDRPADREQALEAARRVLTEAPVLIPLFGHRYIPAEPSEAGNPVLSVYQPDIIYYGNDLASYFQREFGVPQPEWAGRVRRPIRFWDELIEYNNR